MSSIVELFSRDPLEMSKQDIDEVISYMRQKREEYKAKVRAPKAKPKKVDVGEIRI